MMDGLIDARVCGVWCVVCVCVCGCVLTDGCVSHTVDVSYQYIQVLPKDSGRVFRVHEADTGGAVGR